MKLAQEAAFELLQADARFLYALVDIQRNAKNIESNYIGMSMPYIGIFTDGAEQWYKKIKVEAPSFSPTEKEYYTQLRLGHKLFNLSYEDYYDLQFNKLRESDKYFFSIRSLLEKIIGYNNVGTDVFQGEFCGNTILCSIYTPIVTLGNEQCGEYIRNMSVIAGKLAVSFGCINHPTFNYDDKQEVEYKDYHFYNNSPLKMNNDVGFILFSILCSVNFAIVFIDNYFLDEIPQKLKFAYLQYYYLCDFIDDLNMHNGTCFYLSKSLYNRDFRNCLAHYGLGQYLNDSEIIPYDHLKGLTFKAFGKDYYETKEVLYTMLKNLSTQIKKEIF
ncbi:MAG: hypothetical protein VB061_02115 [Christensenella sp.]|nr:hypothetical protein [Christensenella sp.]